MIIELGPGPSSTTLKWGCQFGGQVMEWSFSPLAAVRGPHLVPVTQTVADSLVSIFITS
jgi:hypothetical protein